MVQSSVSVIVVSYNTKEKLRKCLEAIEPEHEVIVVDNASHDGSPQMVAEEFPWVRLIVNPGNPGLGTANNQGAAVAGRPLLLYLNSDAYAEAGAIDRLAGVFEDPSIAAAGGRLLNPDLTLQLSSANRLTLWAVFCEQFYLEKLGMVFPILNPYWNTPKLIEQPVPAETWQVMGAALMVRAGLESFDERYFLYCEDTDLCHRLHLHGRIVFVKNASFVHDLGSSSSGNAVKGVPLYNRGKELYFAIHRGQAASNVCLILDRCGAFLRWTYWSLRSLSGSKRARELSNGFWGVLTGPAQDPIRS
ncbi:MAG TPA: glycosyltransferase family 2 protein [Fimbriimonas sp.]|nr:glycosyltransferase family 2 protein [Fimbriimonas sp.]